MDIDAAIDRVRSGQICRWTDESVMGRIIAGAGDETQIADLLAALHIKGETVEEVAGAAAAMRGHMTPIRSAVQDCSIPAARAATAPKPSTSALPPAWPPPPECPSPNMATAA